MYSRTLDSVNSSVCFIGMLRGSSFYRWCVICNITFSFFFFFFKQKTAYEMRISDWSSDVCSSDLTEVAGCPMQKGDKVLMAFPAGNRDPEMFEDGDRRSEERRVGKECVSPCRSRWSQYH